MSLKLFFTSVFLQTKLSTLIKRSKYERYWTWPKTFCKTVWIKVEVRSKLGASRIFTLDWMVSFKILTKFVTKFWSFCMNDSEQNKAKRHFMLKKALILVLTLTATHFEWILEKCADNLSEFFNSLQKVGRDYCLVENPAVLKRMPWQ